MFLTVDLTVKGILFNASLCRSYINVCFPCILFCTNSLSSWYVWAFFSDIEHVTGESYWPRGFSSLSFSSWHYSSVGNWRWFGLLAYGTTFSPGGASSRGCPRICDLSTLEIELVTRVKSHTESPEKQFSEQSSKERGYQSLSFTQHLIQSIIPFRTFWPKKRFVPLSVSCLCFVSL